MLVFLVMLGSGVSAADALQVRCKEVEDDSAKRVYALVRDESRWNLIYKSKSHREWIRLPLIGCKPKMTKTTLEIDYTSPLGGARVKWSVRGKKSSLYVSNLHELEVNDPTYNELDPDIDEMNTETTLKQLSSEIGDLKIKLD